jgi:hypothetical protein
MIDAKFDRLTGGNGPLRSELRGLAKAPKLDELMARLRTVPLGKD